MFYSIVMKKYLILCIIFLIISLCARILSQHTFQSLMHSIQDHYAIESILENTTNITWSTISLSSGSLGILTISPASYNPTFSINVSGEIRVSYIQEQEKGVYRSLSIQDIIDKRICFMSWCLREWTYRWYRSRWLLWSRWMTMYSYRPLIFISVDNSTWSVLYPKRISEKDTKNRYHHVIPMITWYDQSSLAMNNRFNYTALLQSAWRYSHNSSLSQSRQRMIIQNESGFIYPYPQFIDSLKQLHHTGYMLIQSITDSVITIEARSLTIYQDTWIVIELLQTMTSK